MASQKIIEVNNLSTRLGNEDIIQDISFSAYKGEVTVILGGSGSGKTTLLKTILGLYQAYKGDVNILGNHLFDLDEVELDKLYMQMGVFYQEGALLNSLTVGENVALPLEQHTNLPQELIESIVRMKLSLVNIEYAYSFYPSELSGGMLKRAAIARAIIMDPPILFCDEPGAGLDPVSLDQLDQLILNLKHQLGMSVVMVTHEVSSILKIANRIVFLSDGKLLFEGPFAEAISSNISEIDEFFRKGKWVGPGVNTG
jgi:phospholipid/cholesterol/gamma-HCH transport system ATP-binding protein